MKTKYKVGDLIQTEECGTELQNLCFGIIINISRDSFHDLQYKIFWIKWAKDSSLNWTGRTVLQDVYFVDSQPSKKLAE